MQLQQKLVLLRQRKKDAAERPDSFAAPSGKQEYIFYLYIRVSACARMDFFAAPPGVLKKKVSLYPPPATLLPPSLPPFFLTLTVLPSHTLDICCIVCARAHL